MTDLESHSTKIVFLTHIPHFGQDQDNQSLHLETAYSAELSAFLLSIPRSLIADLSVGANQTATDFQQIIGI